MKHIPKPSPIFVGMSGGVDSSVTAYLLKEAGHHVVGVFMKNWENDDTDTHCAAAQDRQDAQSVCDQLDIKLHLVNFAEHYWERVFTHFLAEYRAGRTPNPDILCNKEIKFNAFLDYAKQCGADYIATGHYVRSMHHNNDLHLLKGSDPNKDQSYFLHTLSAQQLAQSVFPVGHLAKQEVRAIAEKLKLKNYAKKDSTGICFIGERKFKTFLSDYLPAQPGTIETLEGEQMGQHDGLMFYTLGQRQGLQIGGKKDKAPSPWYVAAKDIKRNVLIVVQGEQHPALFKDFLIATNLHWINKPPLYPLKASAKIRYRQLDQMCTIALIQPAATPDKALYRIHFMQPQRAITPGQSVVFYHDALCLGGGIIVS